MVDIIITVRDPVKIIPAKDVNRTATSIHVPFNMKVLVRDMAQGIKSIDAR